MRMAKKLAAVSKITLLLLCCFVFYAKVSAEKCDIYVATGGNATVPLDHNLQNNEKLRWIHKTALIYDRKPGAKYDEQAAKFIHENGSLKRTNVDTTQAGTYKPEVFREDGKKVKDFLGKNLCVMDSVPKPKVKIVCISQKVKFTCANKPKDAKMEWLQNGQPVKTATSDALQLDVNKVEKDTFICRFSNIVSSVSSDPVTQTCKKSGFVFPDTVLGVSIWVFVGGGGGIVLMLIIIVIVCCIQAKRKRSMRVKDEEELRLRYTNPEQQQQQQHQQHQHQHAHPQHQHQHHHQQQPAGHTGPRQHRPKQHREQQRPRAPDPPNGQPQPSPRRPAQGNRRPPDNDDEQPPPLPQPRKKVPKTQRV